MLCERETDPRSERADRDARLILKYRTGRSSAFEELVEAYSGPLARIFAQLRAQPSDVDDLTQDVLMRVFTNLHSFSGEASFYTWFYRVTLNVFFDYTKRVKRADARVARLKASLLDVSAHDPGFGDPVLAWERAALAAEIRSALHELPEEFRGILILREFEDLSYAEIAARSGLSLGNVRSRLSRARRRLHGTLAKR